MIYDTLTVCRKKVSDTIDSALGFAATNAIEAGTPDAPILTVPNATVVAGVVNREFNGVRTVLETYAFTVTVRQAKPTSGVIEDFKIAQSRLLGEALLAVDWPSIGGFRPHVDSYEAAPTDIGKGYVEWALVFSLLHEVFQ